MSWVSIVTEQYSESEAPARFFYWSALACLSAAIRKQAFLDRYTYKLYPNIYVFLVAGSGMKKGIPVAMARSLITKADVTRIVSGRNSVPRILQDLGNAISLESGGVISEAQGILISGELAAFLVKDPDALTILTDLHDTHYNEDFWKNSLKGTGVDKLKSPCLCLLGATNEDHFEEAVPSTAIGGGFIARTFIVFSSDKGKANSLTKPPKKVPDISYLATYLKEVSKTRGQFSWTPAAIDAYDSWYYPFVDSFKHDPTGTYNRLGDQILKVAMLLSLSEDVSLIIKESHIIEAISVSLECLSGMKQVTMGSGKSNLATQTKMVLRELIATKGHAVFRSAILSKYWGDFTDFDLDRVAETLASANAIEIKSHGKDALYVMKQSALLAYTKNLPQ